MAWGWQLWLSPRPSRRTPTPCEPRVLSPNDAALYEFLYEDDRRFVVKETHYAENQAVQDGLSGPPLHIHLRQTEYFEVLQGALAVVRDGKTHVLTQDDGTVAIAPSTRHRFWAHPGKEDLIFKVYAQPEEVDRGFDENYLRNALGYLRDCQMSSIEPSIFQMALFGCLSDTIFVLPPFWMPIWSLKLTQYVCAYWIGRFLLGYRETYPEYSIKK
ncbi:hypothetical protein GGS23DRAFT_474725 [Durotheca rogersii]|uniref:uncharacterized protein n=1 Tax=Durotheca rogersii TaxID=419775 RepID=UPI0022210C10|nr:uncharacterized protein GGS23DRAFT_474725 [Durotheca rogersii]KAI5854498.1 hypothetical protein GGS23DRAFT_474725 [Durotheca rogersii]